MTFDGDATKSYAMITSTSQITGAASESLLIKMINDMFNAAPGIGAVKVLKIGNNDVISDKLTEINDGSWFATLYTNADDTAAADVKKISDWVQTNAKFFYATLAGASETAAPAEIKDDADTNYVGGNNRTAIIVHPVGAHVEAPHLSRYLARGIGLATPAPTNVGARLPGKSASQYSVAKINDILANKGNVYADIKGIIEVNNSLSLTGDTSNLLWSSHFEDAWLDDKIETDLNTFFASRDRTSYTDADINAISGVIGNALYQAGERNIIDRNTGNNPNADYQPTNSDYRFGVVFPTRTQVETSNPQNIVNQKLEASRIWYYKSGNITNINLTILYNEV